MSGAGMGSAPQVSVPCGSLEIWMSPICNRFPEGYLFELTSNELEDLRSKFSSAKFSETRSLPKELGNNMGRIPIYSGVFGG
jgi:hypothetical protein